MVIYYHLTKRIAYIFTFDHFMAIFMYIIIYIAGVDFGVRFSRGSTAHPLNNFWLAAIISTRFLLESHSRTWIRLVFLIFDKLFIKR